jgi:hypothetical protein
MASASHYNKLYVRILKHQQNALHQHPPQLYTTQLALLTLTLPN